MNTPAFKLTLFDLDHTLLPIDSDHAWGEFTTRIGWTDPVAFQHQNDVFFEQYKAATLNIADYIRFATQAIRTKGATQFIAANAQFMSEVITPAILPSALALLKQHQDAGDTVVIVTATHELITRPIATALGVPELISVELARDSTGWITGEIKGVPSAKAGKVTRVAQWLAARGLDWADVQTRFYSDSRNDLPLLEKVNFAVATNPDDYLRAQAVARGWQVLDLFAKR